MMATDTQPLTICGTGHRPGKLGGFSDGVMHHLIALADGWLAEHRPEVVISGMALGWDQALAIAAIKRGIETRAYVPCHGQESRWPAKSQRLYQKILKRCARTLIACPQAYRPECMQLRNELMVDDSQLVLALWDGSSGGTANCIRYARKKGRTIVNLWETWDLKQP